MIDFRPFGGTCALRGCDPKKMLVSGAEAIDFARRMAGHGVAGKLDIDWAELIAIKRSFGFNLRLHAQKLKHIVSVTTRSGRNKSERHQGQERETPGFHDSPL